MKNMKDEIDQMKNENEELMKNISNIENEKKDLIKENGKEEILLSEIEKENEEFKLKIIEMEKEVCKNLLIIEFCVIFLLHFFNEINFSYFFKTS